MSETDKQFEKRRARIEAARAPFDKIRGYLHLSKYGLGVPAFRRVEDAQRALREWRRANSQSEVSYEPTILAVRIAAETFASQIETAGQHVYDDRTIRWVTAGLRCPSRPFCTGCNACQTVTSPERVSVTA